MLYQFIEHETVAFGRSLYPATAFTGSSGKRVLSVSTDKNIIGFMQRHNFEFKELDISETIGHFVQSFDLVAGTFQRPS